MRKSVSKAKSNFAELLAKCSNVPIGDIEATPNPIRVHSRAKLQRLSASVSAYGLIVPIIISQSGKVVDGRARVQVVRELGWSTICAIRVDHLTEEQLRILRLALNRLANEATWDADALRIELDELEEAFPDLDLTLTGFTTPEIDTLRGAYSAKVANDLVDDVSALPSSDDAVSRFGDFFACGSHVVGCHDARSPEAYEQLMQGAEAQVIFTDPPYNVRIDGHVSGMGKQRHREFAVAAGEFDREQFVEFLSETLGAAAAALADGGLAYVCMDHAHIGELIAAGERVFTERKGLCVWDKGAGGMGSLYRNAYELVGVFKKGTARHINNVALGKHGRNRTTIWRYPGIAQQGRGRAKALSLHPTVKPCALVADALLDASEVGGIVLDPFGGSGTTLIAAERTGRRARLLELDPLYVDTIIARYEALTGRSAVHVETGLTLAELKAERAKATGAIVLAEVAP